MKIKSISWAGTKVARVEDVAPFFKDTLGLNMVKSRKDLAVFQLPNGDVFEVIGPTEATELNELTGPKVDFLVDDVQAARAEMEAKGVSFIGEIGSSKDMTWTHFRAPDGNIYGLFRFNSE